MAAKYCGPCSGTGKVTCNRCNGKGTVRGNVNYRKEYTCSKCGGTGEEECSYCQGNGYTYTHED